MPLGRKNDTCLLLSGESTPNLCRLWNAPGARDLRARSSSPMASNTPTCRPQLIRRPPGATVIAIMPERVRQIAVREGYDRWAPGYDGYDNALVALEQPVVERLIGPACGLRVADIGCGTGRLTLPLASAGNHVTGVDFSRGMLDVLRAKCRPGAQLELVQHDLTRGVPLDSDAYDLVLCCLVLEHLPDVELMLAELARICRPGGRVIVSDFHPEMIRRGYHARFREAPGGQKLQIAGSYRAVARVVMAALDARLHITHLDELLMDERTAVRSRSASKWIGLPFLLVMVAAAGPP